LNREEGLILDDTTLAAATTDDYYFPLGNQPGVGVADVEGHWKDAVLRRVILKGTDSNLGFLGVYMQDRSGNDKWIIGPVATQGMRYSANDNGPGQIIEINREVLNVRNIVIRITNTAGAAAKTHSIILIYEPIT